MRGKTIDILHEAGRSGYAVGAFNTSITEIGQGIAGAARHLKKNCIIQVTPTSIEYVGEDIIGAIVQKTIEYNSGKAKIGFHLDHGKSFADVKVAIDKLGVDSVMIDASTKSLEENIALTKMVVDYAHQKGVAVQAELGRVPYIGRDGQTVSWEEVMTKPEEAKRLVEETGIDALAVGIGNAHGFFRERKVPDWERLEKIKKLIPKTPLIMHGASDWDKEKVKNAVSRGIVCFNVDTDLRLAFISAVCNKVIPKCDLIDPRKILEVARESVQIKVEEKIEMFFNAIQN